MNHVEPVQPMRTFAPFAFTDADCCPTCEQPIPRERLAAVKGRHAAHTHELERQLTSSISIHFERLRSDDHAKAALELEATKEAAADLVAKTVAEAEAEQARIRAELEKSFEARWALQLATLEKSHLAVLQERDAKVLGLEAAHQEHRADAARDRAQLTDKLNQVERQRDEQSRTLLEKTAEIERVRSEGVKAADILRAQLAQEHTAEMDEQRRSLEGAHSALIEKLQGRVAEVEQGKQIALDTLRAEMSQQHGEQLSSQRAALQAEHDVGVEQLRVQLTNAEQSKQVAIDAASAELQEYASAARQQIAQFQEKLTAAESAKTAADEQLRSFNEGKVAEIAELRAVLEQDKVASVQALQSQHFEEMQKVKNIADTLQRKLDDRDAQELGEGAELDLFEELKKQFEGDSIYRVKKGAPGADIIHEVREHGVTCGKIVYDSKNRQQWRYEFATKLRADQLAEHADHAILSSNKFREGKKQLDMVDGVVVACPARVLMVANVLRQHIVQMHLVRASTKAREEKAHVLYEFITSPQFAHHFETVNSHVTALETIDKKELEAHQKVWANRDKVIKALEKVNGDLRFEVHKIMGVTDEQQSEGNA